MAAVRFATLSEEDMAVLINGKESNNTKRVFGHTTS